MSASPTSDDPSLPAVLVVEDSEPVRTLTARILAAEGYAVVTAVDGAEAIEVLERSSIRVVIADLRMPRMDGQRLAAQAAARWPELRMVFMTGHPAAALTTDLPGPLLLKPFVPELLAETVRSLLDEGGRPAL
jgi:two-component system cell cycle response regulator CpdR